MFPTMAFGKREISQRGQSSVFDVIQDESKMSAWYNAVTEILGTLEGILRQLKLTERYQIDNIAQDSKMAAGTSLMFKDRILQNRKLTKYY